MCGIVGYVGHRPRCAIALEAIIADYFGVPTRILPELPVDGTCVAMLVGVAEVTVANWLLKVT